MSRNTAHSDAVLHAPAAAGTGPGTPHDAYPLRMVSAQTRLSADLIRAWEKRYGVVRPVRGARGARLYSRRDVEHLRLLARAVAQGRSIGDVARLDDKALTALVATQSERPAIQRHTSLVAEIVDALGRFDTATVHRKLGDALVALGGRDFVLQLATPLLRETGDRWSEGRLSMASEHLLSGMLRSLVTSLIQTQGRTTHPLVLLATPSGERHELGLLLVAFLVLNGGAGLLYLGSDLPGSEIVTAARQSGAAVVGVGVVGQENHPRALREIRIIRDGLPAHTDLWLGGQDAKAVAAGLTTGDVLVMSDLAEVESEVSRLREKPLRSVGRRS